MLLLCGCNQNMNSVQPLAHKAVESITCPNSQSRLFDVAYSALIDAQVIPTEQEMRSLFEQALANHSDAQLDQEQTLKLISEFYKIILSVNAKDPQELLEKLTALEVGDQTTVEAKSSQTQLQRFNSKWENFTAQQSAPCTENSLTPANPSGPTTGGVHTLVYGARKVFVTAYQSCAANEKAPMNKLTPDIEGISIIGTHSDGVGKKRVIKDPAALLRTDYYLQNPGQSSSCKDIRKNPLIYDYGGKPYTTSDPDSALDFSKNGGAGTAVLGVDCSGYVFSAIAAAGLKLHPTKKMKANFVNGISARMYMDPVNNGMPCLEKVKMGVSGDLKPGDLAAMNGHIVMVESVGIDPFGISKAKTSVQCSQVQSSQFNFVVSQSSPSKGGIGLNKFFAADYLVENDTMRAGFEKYAQDACRARLAKSDLQIKATNFQIVRHKMTAVCKDVPIRLVGESCASTCQSLTKLSALDEQSNSSQQYTEALLQ
jgi:hypothetical protein